MPQISFDTCKRFSILIGHGHTPGLNRKTIVTYQNKFATPSQAISLRLITSQQRSKRSLPSALEALDTDEGDLDKFPELLAMSSVEPLVEPLAEAGVESREELLGAALEPVPACEM